MSTLQKFGLKYFPFTHSGVPEIDKISKPVGLDEELRQLLEVVDYFLSTRLNENLLVTVVGEYGWGKTELLDYFTKVLVEKYGDKLEVARLPLTFNLSTKHIVDVLRRRSGKPLVLIIDESDEITRVVALKELSGEEKDVTKVLTELGTVIRAIIEPRQYENVLKIPLAKLKNILLIVALTPQLYYSILKSTLPDIFDITIGRVFREVILKGEVPLWMYHGIVQEKLKVASTEDRLVKIKQGLDPCYPLKFEYLASLYYLLYLNERQYPSPRILLKYTATLLDTVLKYGKLDVDVYLAFLNELKEDVKIIKKILEQVETLSTVYEDKEVLKARLLFELVPLPLTLKFLREELGQKAESIVEAFKRSGIIEEVQLLKLPLDKSSIDRLSKVVTELELFSLESSGLRRLSIELDNYYTFFHNERPYLCVVISSEYKIKQSDGIEVETAYRLRERVLLTLGVKTTPEHSIVTTIRNIYSLFTRPRELADKIAEIVLGSRVRQYITGDNFVVYCSEDTLDIRQCLIFAYVQDDEALRSCLSRVEDIVRMSAIPLRGGEAYYDILHVVVFAPTLQVDRSVIEELLDKPWKLPSFKVRDFCKVYVIDSTNLDKFRKVVIGYELSKLGTGESISSRFTFLVKLYEEFRQEVHDFVTRCRNVVLRELCLSLKKGRESKSTILKNIVQAWVRGEKLLDQPEVFRDPSGVAKISRAELHFLEYLRESRIERLTAREAERLVRALFPVNLWREIREKDFIELCKLRGILLSLGQTLLVYEPSLARDLILREIKELKDCVLKLTTSKKLRLEFIDVELNLKISEVDEELNSRLRRLEQLATQLLDLDYSEESLRKVSQTLLELSDVRQLVQDRYSKLSQTLTKVEEEIRKLNERLSALRQMLDELSKFRLNNVTTKVKEKLVQEVQPVLKLVETCDVLTSEQIYDVVHKLVDVYTLVEQRCENIRKLVIEISRLREKAENILYIPEVEAVLQDINLMLTLDSVDIEQVENILHACHSVLSSKVSEKLSRLLAELEHVKQSLTWICEKASSLLDDSMCSNIQSLSFRDLNLVKSKLKKVYEKLAAQLNVDVSVVQKLVGIRGEITPEKLAEITGLSMAQCERILDKMCVIGLAKKVYVL